MNEQKIDIPSNSSQSLPASKSKPESISMFQLFVHTTRQEKVIIFVATIAAIASGLVQTFNSLLFGDISDSFDPSQGVDAMMDKVLVQVRNYLILAAASFVLAYFSLGWWMIIGEKQGIKYRKLYFAALMRQEIGFYDNLNPNELASKVSSECSEIQAGMGQKISTFIMTFSSCISGYILGFVKCWQLTLVLTACIPVLGICGGFLGFSMSKAQSFRNDSYSKAGAVAEESLGAVRTVSALCIQNSQIKRYTNYLIENKGKIVKFIFLYSVAIGILIFSINSSWGLGFWFSSKLVEDKTVNPVSGDPYTTGDILSCFLGVLIGTSGIGQLAPCLKAFAAAREAGARAMKVINRQSKIDVSSKHGQTLEKVEGEISFDDVKFAYPLKPEKTILKGISFKIQKNKKTALVGESGCGKTTSMQLIERFYDPDSGKVLLDGTDVKNLNLRWLRSQIGYVGQEPVLFATTIKENMSLAKDDVTDSDIWEALAKANAKEFVEGLPEKLETYVGVGGIQLSGGQKQRIAIARAILKKPPILLLDEATSALDRKNEKEIQETLDEISEGRTTIVIAHRLSTVRNADHIIVFDQGVILEEGTHEELVQKKGKYFNLQHGQLSANEQNGTSPEDVKVGENESAPALKEAIVKSKDAKISPEKKEENSNGESSSSVVATSASKKKIQPKLSKEEMAKKKKAENEAITRLFKYNKKERKYLAIAFFGAAVAGCSFPIISIFFSEMLRVFTIQDENFREDSNRYSLYFVLAGIAGGFGNLLQNYFLGINGEALTIKLRIDLFAKLIKMPISWHDLPENTPGALTTKLSNDCFLVNSLAGNTIGISLNSMAGLVCGLIIAFYSSWQLTLCNLAFLPLLMISFKIQDKAVFGIESETNDLYKESGAFIADAVINMRTVASFGREDIFNNKFVKRLEVPAKQATRKGNLAGLALGASQFLLNAQNAYIFYLASIFTRDLGLDYGDMFKSIFGIFFAGMTLGQAAQFMPDVASAKIAAVGMFKMLDTKPEIDIDNPEQSVRTPIKGEIEFKNVSFKYPTRDRQIFSDLSLSIKQSSKVALVGSSGCGKSTIIALLMRFYDPQQGSIYIDGVDIKKYDIQHLRKSFGYVSQEPFLFNGSIDYNIKFGKTEATDEEVRNAAAEANALKFIENNEFEGLQVQTENKDDEKGFKRKVGPKGSQISGGQKQRIAIARAVIGKPHVLLLDEATSALDAENEKIVQVSLDKIMEGKTSVVVAHRISTIKDANEIIVFEDGVVVERGDYEMLEKKKGLFYRLENGLSE